MFKSHKNNFYTKILNSLKVVTDQVKIGGKLVLPVGTYFQKLKLITKLRDGKIEEETVTSVRFVPMVHFDKTPQNDSKVRLTK